VKHHFPNPSQKPLSVQSPRSCPLPFLKRSTRNWQQRMRLAMTGSPRKVGNSARCMAPTSARRIFASAPPTRMQHRCASRAEGPTWAIIRDSVVDGGKRRIILAVLVTPGEVMDNHPMQDLLWHTCFRWRLRPKQVTADSLYGTGENLKAIEEAGMRAYIPISERGQHNIGYYGSARFTYDASQDLYCCPQGQVLRPTFRLERIQEVQYRADAAVCKACPVKTQCTESPGGRRVHRSFFADYVERVKGYQQTATYQKALNKRKVWVEPLFAEGKQWHGMGRFRLRRLWRVNCEALVIATGQNLKRLLQMRGWGRRPFPAEAAALALPVHLEPEPSRRDNRWKSDQPSVALVTCGTRRHVGGAEDVMFFLEEKQTVCLLHLKHYLH
jgi:Transposase DDE domain